MIKVDNLTKWYGDEKAVDNISFTIADGEILGFLGPNGAGKTTTMKMITGYMPPSEGSVVVDGLDFEKNSIEIRRKIGYLPESAPLYPDMNVDDFLDFVARMRDIPSNERKRRIDEIAEVCGLNGVRHKDIGKLSKGYRQRTGLAQALIHDPDFLVLDEPTSGLDPNQIVEIRNLIREISKENTIILSTHILSEVQATCDRIVIIHHGKLVADGPLDEITGRFTGTKHLRLILAGDAVSVEKSLSAQPFGRSFSTFKPETENTAGFEIAFSADEDIREQVFDWVVSSGWKLLEMHTISRSLEEVFRELTISADQQS